MNTAKVRLQKAIAKGDADIEAGRVTTYRSPRELTDKIKKRGRQAFNKKAEFQITVLAKTDLYCLYNI